jgi:hypothetical protein
MKNLITPVAVLFFGVCTSFAQENTAEKTTGSKNGKSIDCHLKLDGVKGESTQSKTTTAQDGDIEYSYKPQKAVATSGENNSSSETQENTQSKSKEKEKGNGGEVKFGWNTRTTETR